MQDSVSLRVGSLLTPLKFKVCKTTARSVMPPVLEMPFFYYFFLPRDYYITCRW